MILWKFSLKKRLFIFSENPFMKNIALKKAFFLENAFVKIIALEKAFYFFGKWFCEKSRSREGFLFFWKTHLWKISLYRRLFIIFGKWFCEKSRSREGFLFFLENPLIKNFGLKKAFSFFSENGFVKIIALEKVFLFFSEKSCSREGYFLFSESDFVKSLAPTPAMPSTTTPAAPSGQRGDCWGHRGREDQAVDREHPGAPGLRGRSIWSPHHSDEDKPFADTTSRRGDQHQPISTCL